MIGGMPSLDELMDTVCNVRGEPRKYPIKKAKTLHNAEVSRYIDADGHTQFYVQISKSNFHPYHSQWSKGNNVKLASVNMNNLGRDYAKRKFYRTPDGYATSDRMEAAVDPETGRPIRYDVPYKNEAGEWIHPSLSMRSGVEKDEAINDIWYHIADAIVQEETFKRIAAKQNKSLNDAKDKLIKEFVMRGVSPKDAEDKAVARVASNPWMYINDFESQNEYNRIADQVWGEIAQGVITDMERTLKEQTRHSELWAQAEDRAKFEYDYFKRTGQPYTEGGYSEEDLTFIPDEGGKPLKVFIYPPATSMQQDGYGNYSLKPRVLEIMNNMMNFDRAKDTDTTSGLIRIEDSRGRSMWYDKADGSIMEFKDGEWKLPEEPKMLKFKDLADEKGRDMEISSDRLDNMSEAQITEFFRTHHSVDDNADFYHKQFQDELQRKKKNGSNKLDLYAKMLQNDYDIHHETPQQAEIRHKNADLERRRLYSEDAIRQKKTLLQNQATFDKESQGLLNNLRQLNNVVSRQMSGTDLAERKARGEDISDEELAATEYGQTSPEERAALEERRAPWLAEKNRKRDSLRAALVEKGAVFQSDDPDSPQYYSISTESEEAIKNSQSVLDQAAELGTRNAGENEFANTDPYGRMVKKLKQAVRDGQYHLVTDENGNPILDDNGHVQFRFSDELEARISALADPGVENKDFAEFSGMEQLKFNEIRELRDEALFTVRKQYEDNNRAKMYKLRAAKQMVPDNPFHSNPAYNNHSLSIDYGLDTNLQMMQHARTLNIYSNKLAKVLRDVGLSKPELIDAIDEIKTASSLGAASKIAREICLERGLPEGDLNTRAIPYLAKKVFNSNDMYTRLYRAFDRNGDPVPYPRMISDRRFEDLLYDGMSNALMTLNENAPEFYAKFPNAKKLEETLADELSAIYHPEKGPDGKPLPTPSVGELNRKYITALTPDPASLSDEDRAQIQARFRMYLDAVQYDAQYGLYRDMRNKRYDNWANKFEKVQGTPEEDKFLNQPEGPYYLRRYLATNGAKLGEDGKRNIQTKLDNIENNRYGNLKDILPKGVKAENIWPIISDPSKHRYYTDDDYFSLDDLRSKWDKASDITERTVKPTYDDTIRRRNSFMGYDDRPLYKYSVDDQNQIDARAKLVEDLYPTIFGGRRSYEGISRKLSDSDWTTIHDYLKGYTSGVPEEQKWIDQLNGVNYDEASPDDQSYKDLQPEMRGRIHRMLNPEKYSKNKKYRPEWNDDDIRSFDLGVRSKIYPTARRLGKPVKFKDWSDEDWNDIDYANRAIDDSHVAAAGKAGLANLASKTPERWSASDKVNFFRNASSQPKPLGTQPVDTSVPEPEPNPQSEVLNNGEDDDSIKRSYRPHTMEDHMRSGTMMSMREMMEAIMKSDEKSGHPYGKPIQGNVFAYGSTQTKMGEGKDKVMPDTIPEHKDNTEGVSRKKIDL